MDNQTIKTICSQHIQNMDGETLGKMVIWFNRTPLTEIKSLFSGNFSTRQELERIVSFPCEFSVNSNKLEGLRDFINTHTN